MNVAFDKLSTGDAAKMIGIDKTTVAAWCRNGLINFTNVSDGTGKARYMLAEDEVMHLKSLFKKYGKRKAMMYYKKDWNTICEKKLKMTTSAEEAMFIDKPELAHVDDNDISKYRPSSDVLNSVNTVDRLQDCFPNMAIADTEQECSEEVFKRASTTKMNPDKILDTIMYIQDIKERLEDLEAEKNQLLKEKEDLVKEIMEFL